MPAYGEMRVVPPEPGSLGDLAGSQGHQEVWNGEAWEAASEFFARQMQTTHSQQRNSLGPAYNSLSQQLFGIGK